MFLDALPERLAEKGANGDLSARRHDGDDGLMSCSVQAVDHIDGHETIGELEKKFSVLDYFFESVGCVRLNI